MLSAAVTLQMTRIPDCVRAVEKGDTIIVSVILIRQELYQHVLEPLKIYLMIVEAQYKNHELGIL